MSINNKIKWAAMVLTVIGAVLTSMQADPYNIYLLNIGSFLYFVWSIRIKEWSITLLHVGLMSVYAVGGLIRLFY